MPLFTFGDIDLTVLRVTGLPAQVTEGSHGKVVRPAYYAVRVTIAGLPKRTRYVLRGTSWHEYNESFCYMDAIIRESKDPNMSVEVFRRGADNAEIAVAATTLPLESLKGKRKDPMLAIPLPQGITVHCAIKWSGVKDTASLIMLVGCSIS